MPKKASLLNVRDHLNHVIFTCDGMLERDGKYEGGLRLAPIDKSNLVELRLFSRAILRKTEEKNKKTGQRRDVYVNSSI